MISEKLWTNTDPKDVNTLELRTHLSKLYKDKIMSLQNSNEEEEIEHRPLTTLNDGNLPRVMLREFPTLNNCASINQRTILL